MLKNGTLVFLILNILFSCNKESSTIEYKIGLLTQDQNYKPLHENYSFKLDSTGFSKFPKFTFECIENDSSSFWHVQDLNNDGKKDLIYSGPCMPYSETAIFINKEGKMELIDQFSGKLISIKKDKNYTKMYVLAKSCCCEHYSYLKEINITNSFQLKESKIKYHSKTEISTSKAIEKKTISGILRQTPIIDDEVKKDPCTDDLFTGNQISQIKNKTVSILDEKNEWSLVLFKENNLTEIIGWVKTD